MIGGYLAGAVRGRPAIVGYRWRARAYPHAVPAAVPPEPTPQDRRRRRDDETCQAVLDILRRIDAGTGGGR